MPRQETIDKRIAAGLCPSWIGHGPGHQSTTFCTQQGEHEIHSARYGSFDQYAEWGGGDHVFSGFFDEPPREGE